MSENELFLRKPKFQPNFIAQAEIQWGEKQY